MEIRRLRTLTVEIFKTLNEINPLYMQNIFTPKENSKVRQNHIIVKRINSSRFGTQSLRSLGPKIWNNQPSNMKSETSFPKFKGYIKTWLRPKCTCKVCINMLAENVLLFLIYKFITFLHIFYSYLYFLKILARNWSVFMHSLCCFIFVYMQIYFFAWINKAFIYSFIHSYQQKRLLLKKLAIPIWYLLFGFDILYNDISIALGGLFFCWMGVAVMMSLIKIPKICPITP